MLLNWPAFVLQRRINRPLDATERAVCDAQLLRAGALFALDEGALMLRVDGDFALTFPPFGLENTSWRAPASICTRRGRRIENLELELNPWDRASTELVVRPRSRRILQWSGRRTARYFRTAHASADVLARLLGSYEPVRGPLSSRAVPARA